jgi:hypothetical protein
VAWIVEGMAVTVAWESHSGAGVAPLVRRFYRPSRAGAWHPPDIFASQRWFLNITHPRVRRDIN